MKRIFIDLEMHPVARAYSEPFQMLKKETIEIGAVMLDEQLREIASFKEFVRPSYSDKVYPKYQKFTGITTKMLKSADCFQSVFKRFCDWCGQDYIIYSWSEDDIWQLMQEYQYKGIEYSKEIRYMFNHWKDFQADFGSMLNLKRQLSLADAVLVGGLNFAGHAHDGLVDARNTANLFRQTSDSGSDEFKRLLQNIEEARRPCTFSQATNKEIWRAERGKNHRSANTIYRLFGAFYCLFDPTLTQNTDKFEEKNRGLKKIFVGK